MSDAMQVQKQFNMDEKEEAEELKKLEEMDAVNEESKAAMANMLAGKMAKQAAENKAAEEEIQAKIEEGENEESWS